MNERPVDQTTVPDAPPTDPAAPDTAASRLLALVVDDSDEQLRRDFAALLEVEEIKQRLSIFGPVVLPPEAYACPFSSIHHPGPAPIVKESPRARKSRVGILTRFRAERSGMPAGSKLAKKAAKGRL
jgi:hypothetical protein